MQEVDRVFYVKFISLVSSAHERNRGPGSETYETYYYVDPLYHKAYSKPKVGENAYSACLLVAGYGVRR